MINLISHIDLDGYGCNILMTKGYPGEIGNIRNVNYDDLATALMDMDRDETLFITDLSIPENLKGLLEEFSDLVIIDHHESSKWIRDWANDREGVTAVISTERCATYLLGEFLRKFNPTLYSTDWANDWMTLIDDYDRWVHAYPESDRLNSLLYISNRQRFVNDATYNSPYKVLDMQKDRIDRYINTRDEYVATVNVYPLYKFPEIGVCFAEKYRSHVASANVRNKDHDGYELLFILSMREGVMSVRSAEDSDYDCSEICHLLDEEGGGHIHAGGCKIPQMTLEGKLGIQDELFNVMSNKYKAHQTEHPN